MVTVFDFPLGTDEAGRFVTPFTTWLVFGASGVF